MQVEERVIGGPAGSNLMAADDFRCVHDDPADLILVENDAIGEDA